MIAKNNVIEVGLIFEDAEKEDQAVRAGYRPQYFKNSDFRQIGPFGWIVERDAVFEIGKEAPEIDLPEWKKTVIRIFGGRNLFGLGKPYPIIEAVGYYVLPYDQCSPIFARHLFSDGPKWAQGGGSRFALHWEGSGQ